MRHWLIAFMRRLTDRLVDSHQRNRRRCEQALPDRELVAGLEREAISDYVRECEAIAREIGVEHPEASLASRRVAREIAAIEGGKVAPIKRKAALARVK